MRRSLGILVTGAVLAAGLLPAGMARAAVTAASGFASPIVEPSKADEAPVLILAQRVIDRAWGPPEGVPPEIPPAGLISEGDALALSAAVPGAGQYYAGASSAVWFALVEVAGWTTHWIFNHDADHQKQDADRFVGVPSDTASAWSADRWERAGPGRDAAPLELLYVADRNAYYALISRDPQYYDGWAGPNPGATRADFQHLRDLEEGSLERARLSGEALWLNHVFSAFDALRAARIHNLPIRRNLELEIKSSWHGRGPTMSAALERKF